MTDQTPPGWYPDPVRPGSQRYWDGTQWTVDSNQTSAPASSSFSTPPPPPPRPSYIASAPTTPTPRGSNSTGLWIIVGVGVAGLFALGVVLAVVLGGTAANPTIAGGSAQAACETVASEAVRISQEQNPPPAAHILKIRAVSIVSDARETYVPPLGASEATVLTCTGEASWSDASVGKVFLTETIDADGMIFIKYQPIP